MIFLRKLNSMIFVSHSFVTFLVSLFWQTKYLDKEHVNNFVGNCKDPFPEDVHVTCLQLILVQFCELGKPITRKIIKIY